MTDQTHENMRAWEERLGPEKASRAVSILRSHGWPPGSAPPTWVVANVFMMVEGKIPEQWGTHQPQSLSESLFGAKLF